MKEYQIPIQGLKVGSHQYKFHIKKDFFEHFEYNELFDADISVVVTLDKKERLSELEVALDGTVNLSCDRCLEDLQIDILSINKMIIKMSDRFEEISEELIQIDEKQNVFDIAQYIYEYVVLAIPSKNTHDEQDCSTKMLEVLDELSAVNEELTDPRWDQLKDLIK